MAYDAYTDLLNSIQRMGDAYREYDRRQAIVDDYEKDLAKLREDHRVTKSLLAMMCALRGAFEQELRKADPANALLHDAALRERIKKAGNSAFWAHPDPDGVQNYGVATQVGRTFKIEPAKFS